MVLCPWLMTLLITLEANTLMFVSITSANAPKMAPSTSPESPAPTTLPTSSLRLSRALPLSVFVVSLAYINNWHSCEEELLVCPFFLSYIYIFSFSLLTNGLLHIYLNAFRVEEEC